MSDPAARATYQRRVILILGALGCAMLLGSVLIPLAALIRRNMDFASPPPNADPAEAGAVAYLREVGADMRWNVHGNVREVRLSGLAVTRHVLESLRELRHVEYLELIAADVTDSDLSRLTQLPRLRGIELTWTPVTDDAIPHLAAMPSLRAAGLRNTNITDAGLDYLMVNPSALTHLYLSGTQVTADGVQRLRTARPEWVIRFR